MRPEKSHNKFQFSFRYKISCRCRDEDADSKFECKQARLKRSKEEKEKRGERKNERVYSECCKISNAANKNGNDGAQSETFIK